jgi:PPM family protein phosphatase
LVDREPGELVLRSFGWTDVGKKRKANEDFYSIVEDAELFILADGMGGHSSGEVASRLATRHLVDFVVDLSNREDFEFSSDVPPIDDPHERLVHAAILYANERVYIESMKDRAYEGMGTTLCVALGTGDRLVFAHVGDSRIYRLRDGKLTQVTEDHSWINHLIRTGQMTPERAATAKGKNVIMRAVGLKGSVIPDVQSVEKRAGDLYLFCSDGLSDLVEDWILENMLRSEGHDLYACSRALIKIANDYGGKDNITVLLVRVLEVGAEAPGQGREKPGTASDEGIFDVDTDKIALSDLARS